MLVKKHVDLDGRRFIVTFDEAGPLRMREVVKVLPTGARSRRGTVAKITTVAYWSAKHHGMPTREKGVVFRALRLAVLK